MLKKFLLILFCFGLNPAWSGELEEAFYKKDYVFLYLYTPECGYCKKFEPKFEILSKTYDNYYAFLKINAKTSYGYKLMRTYNGRYVPFVLLLNKNTKQGAQVNTECLMNNVCMDKVLKDFRN